jgi:hypothetical protein
METYISEVVSIIKDINCLCSQLIQNPPTVSHNTCEHDECEMFFLSLAKTVKRLAPAEQVKMGVSEIVFLAELILLKTSHNSIIIININTFHHVA